MKKKLAMLFAAALMAVMVGCATTPSLSEFETVMKQGLTQALPQAQKLVDQEVAAGKLTKEQGDMIMQVLNALAEQKAAKAAKK